MYIPENQFCTQARVKVYNPVVSRWRAQVAPHRQFLLQHKKDIPVRRTQHTCLHAHHTNNTKNEVYHTDNLQ